VTPAEETARRLARGRALFNRGSYFEAHEVWEEAWLSEEGEARRILQGLIQIAAAGHKATVQKQAAGCVRLLEAGLARLAVASEDFAGVALARFRRGVKETLREARRWERGERRSLGRSAFALLEEASKKR